MSWKKDLTTFTKSRSKKLGDNGVFPDETVLGIFIDLVEVKNFTQIIFEFGKHYLEVLLMFCEVKEEYRLCAEILEQVKKHNKTEGTNIILERW